jgi:hypothetical protein
MNATCSRVLAAGRSAAAFCSRETRLAVTTTAFLTPLTFVLYGLGLLGRGQP